MEDEETTEPQPGSEEELDIELSAAIPQRKRSGGKGTLIALLVIIAAVVVLILVFYRGHLAAQKRAEREQARSAQLDGLAKTMVDAVTRVQQGDLDTGLAQMRRTSRKLGELAQAAQGEGDAAAAALLTSRREDLVRVLREAESGQQNLIDQVTEDLWRSATSISEGRVKGPGGTPAPGAATSPGPTSSDAPTAETASPPT